MRSRLNFFTFWVFELVFDQNLLSINYLRQISVYGMISPMFSIIFLGSGEIFHVFSVVFQASKGKKLQWKGKGKFYETRNFDATHSTKALTKYERPKIKRYARQKCSLLFFVGYLFSFMALRISLGLYNSLKD